MFSDSSNNSFFRFFLPKILTEPVFGLDISDESLKFAELVFTKGGLRLGRYGERSIPSGIIDSGEIKDFKKMKEILFSLRKEEGVESVRVSLPEKVMRENYLSIFKHSQITVKAFEREAQAAARAVIKKDDLGTYMVVNFGKKRTSIFIVSKGIVVFTFTLNLGGMVLTEMIQKNLKVSLEEAEKMKHEYKLERNTNNEEISAIFLNSVSILRDEIGKHFLSWQTHKNEKGKNNPPIKKIIFYGKDSCLIGLAEYVAASLKTPVEIANVWINIFETEHSVPEMSFKQSLTFTTALGLALGEIKWIK